MPPPRRSVRVARPRSRSRRTAALDPVSTPGAVVPALPPGWREFVGRWLQGEGCTVSPAARGDWEVELSPGLQRRWRRHRVRLVFDPQRSTLPRGAWFTAPASVAGRKVLDAATEEPSITRRTALPQVPGAPASGIASVCKVRGLTWGPARLGPVRYERRVSVHAVVTRWGGMPWQEPWVVMFGPEGELVEWCIGTELPGVRPREGLYQLNEEMPDDGRKQWMARARERLDVMLREREAEWDQTVSRLRDVELERLGSFFSSRIEEEEERLRRRTGAADESEIEGGDATSLKLEWERRAAEVRHRWGLRTEVRLWGLVEWSWPVAEIEQELRTGAVHVKLTASVDVARGLPALPGCPGCGAPAEMLVRVRGAVACAQCA